MSFLSKTILTKRLAVPLIFSFGAVCFIPATLPAAGKQNPTALNAAEVRISTEVVPAGGTAQVKFSLTEPRPIMSSGTSMAIGGMAIDGVAIWSSTGTAAGLGVLKNGILTFTALDPSGVLGMNTDYPFITVTMDVPATVPTGTTIGLNWTDPFLTSPTGPLSLSVKPGKVTIGGSVSIRGVYPGGGTYPAGTVIRIPGMGFGPFTRVQSEVKYSAISITPTEIDLTLKEQTTMDAKSFQVTNPDGYSDTYIAYLRGTLLRAPSRPLLLAMEPAFQLQTHAIATIGPVPAAAPGQFIALALQNPSAGPLVVTFELKTHGSNRTTSVLLPPGNRIVDDLAFLLGGTTLQQGDTIQITSTSPLQILGINGNENTGTAVPFLPVF